MPSILLIDDERWVRTAIRRTIERTELPFQVLKECVNGLEALDWLQANKIDLIMVDIRMPVMDGLQFMTQLRECNPLQEIVMISGHDDFNFAREALRMGALDYLLKPVEVEDMRKCLEQYQRRALASVADAVKIATQLEADPDLSPIEQAIRFVKMRFPGEVTLRETAAHVHLNPSYLSQLFKLRMNQTFVDYVQQMRMNEAEKLLRVTSLRISEISERLGYADLAYFSATFKRVKGCTPSEYRKETKVNSLTLGT